MADFDSGLRHSPMTHHFQFISPVEALVLMYFYCMWWTHSCVISDNVVRPAGPRLAKVQAYVYVPSIDPLLLLAQLASETSVARSSGQSI